MIPLPPAVAWRYVPSPVWGDAIVTQDHETVELAKSYGQDPEMLHTTAAVLDYAAARVAEAVAAERERCAKVCHDYAKRMLEAYRTGGSQSALDEATGAAACADAIRAGSGKGES